MKIWQKQMANLIKQRIITMQTYNAVNSQATILQDVLPLHYFDISFLSCSNSCAIIYLTKEMRSWAWTSWQHPTIAFSPWKRNKGSDNTSWEPFDLQMSKENCSTLPEIELLNFSLWTCNCPVMSRHQQIIYSSIKIKANHVDWWALVFKSWLQNHKCISNNLNKVLILQRQYHWSMTARPCKAE